MAPRKPRKPATPEPLTSKYVKTDPADPEAPRVLAEYVTVPAGHLLKPGDRVTYDNPAMPGLGNPTPGGGPMVIAELILYPDPERPLVEAITDAGAYSMSADNLVPVDEEGGPVPPPAVEGDRVTEWPGGEVRPSSPAERARSARRAAGLPEDAAEARKVLGMSGPGDGAHPLPPEYLAPLMPEGERPEPASPSHFIEAADAEHRRTGTLATAAAAFIGAEADARQDRVFAAQLADALGAPIAEVDRAMREATEVGLLPLAAGAGQADAEAAGPRAALARTLRRYAAELDEQAEGGGRKPLGERASAVLRMAALAVEPGLTVAITADSGRAQIRIAGAVAQVEQARRVVAEELPGEWPDLSACTAHAFAAYEAIQGGEFDPYLPILGGAIHARRVRMAAEAIETVRAAGGDPDDPDDPAWAEVASMWRPRRRPR